MTHDVISLRPEEIFLQVGDQKIRLGTFDNPTEVGFVDALVGAYFDQIGAFPRNAAMSDEFIGSELDKALYATRQVEALLLLVNSIRPLEQTER